MTSRLKAGAMIIGLTLGLCAFASSAMAGGFNLGEFLKSLPPPPTPPQGQPQAQQPSAPAMAVQPEEGQSKPVQLIIPSDKRVAAAIDVALPIIKKVV